MKDCPCNICLVNPICKECCLEQHLWTSSLTTNQKLEYFEKMKDEMKVVTPQIRREFQKIKYGMEFG